MKFSTICKIGARIAYPNATEKMIEKIWPAIWGASRDGSLWHVFMLRDLLEENANNFEENATKGISLFVKSLRGVDRTAQYEELQLTIGKNYVI